MLSQRRRI
jgi:hypothetical protein